MSEEQKAVATVGAPSELIKVAIEGKADLEKLEKLLILQEKFEANEAKKAYHRAMAAFKADPPRIEKDRTVSFNNTNYNYASLANVTGKINTALSKYGLSASWVTKTNGMISVTCKITHELGHSEETTLTADADKTGSKNSIQAMGSTIAYLERYTLLALTGLAAEDMDDDARSAENIEYITAEQLSKLIDILDNTEPKVNKKKLLAYLKVESFDKLLLSDYQKAIVAIQNIQKAGKP